MAKTDYENYVPKGDRRQEFMGIFVLDYMINGQNGFPIPLSAKDLWLKPVLEWLYGKGYLTYGSEMDDYVPSDGGRKVLERFMQKYSEYLQFYDRFCAVDLSAGEFAFASYFDFDTDESWSEFLADDRFVDLRVTVAEFKNMDPFEIVFMSFLNEKRFDFDLESNEWKKDLLSGEIWDEIAVICQTAYKVDDLGYAGDGGDVTGQSVLEDVISHGVSLTKDLISEEDEYNKARLAEEEEIAAEAEEEVVETTTTTEEVVEETNEGGYGWDPIDAIVFGSSYYDPFYDPFYVSSVWDDPWYF
jgi:hypothetical protein